KNPKNKYEWFTKKWGLFQPGKDGKPYDKKSLPKGYNNDEYIKDLMTVMNDITGNSYATNREGLKQMRQDQFKSNPEYVKNARENNFWNANATDDKEYADATR